MQDVPRGHDGVQSSYCIDRSRLAWLAKDLAANCDKPKVVFCHEEFGVAQTAYSDGTSQVRIGELGAQRKDRLHE